MSRDAHEVSRRFEDAARTGRPLLLDGGLSNALEARGHDLSDALWSARLLIDDPDEVREVHRAYLRAGADVISTMSYQASFEGFARRGLVRTEVEGVLRRSVDLAVEARDLEADDRPDGTAPPLIAASIGPYGAMRADGSEYRGDYGVSAATLRSFHEPRWRVLCDTPADLLACETIPSAAEVDALLELLASTPDRLAWISFSCRDERSISDGTPIAEVTRRCAEVANVLAVGVNCLSPTLVPPLLAELRTATDLPLVVYPNSGEVWNAKTRGWDAGDADGDWCGLASGWATKGIAAIGGCCRVGPDRIAELGERLRRRG